MSLEEILGKVSKRVPLYWEEVINKPGSYP
jgi:hypothetical protein